MKLQLNVPDMTCDGCVRNITYAIKAVDANASIHGDPKTKIVLAKIVLVETEASEVAIKSAISAAGYQVN
ncbi:MAG: heavy metal transporter [Oscillatoriales cyanobacterium CG2_30_44_21]|nr:MAG: heavy metal transporter [Oscillatoriales cyanobacterium CG2_30_44_21]